MLTADLVRVRRRDGRIEPRPLNQKQRTRLLEQAEAFVTILDASRGSTQAALDSRWDEVAVNSTDFKILKGLRKLLKDRCTFAIREGIDPVALRHDLFARASEARRALGDDERLDREAILRAVGADHGLADAAADTGVEETLFADLKKHHILVSHDPIDAAGLLLDYERSQQQAILLRATRVVITINQVETGATRAFFHKLKFRRLLYRIDREGDGVRIEIDGPLSLFRSMTKYGLALALLLPALEECPDWSLEADVRWDRSREVSRFTLASAPRDPVPESLPVPTDEFPDEVTRLRQSFGKKKTPWTVEPASEVLDLPGVGLCVPDLVFRHPDQSDPVYLELMGFWSRDAVWRRVELIQAGLTHRIIFAVSHRLRVSEEVLDPDLPGQLYVYKGVPLAGEILSRLEDLVAS